MGRFVGGFGETGTWRWAAHATATEAHRKPLASRKRDEEWLGIARARGSRQAKQMAPTRAASRVKFPHSLLGSVFWSAYNSARIQNALVRRDSIR
jgi:hypothetical protein